MTKPFTPLFLAGLMAVSFVPAASAASVSLGPVIDYGGFQNNLWNTRWNTTGTVNRRAETDTINTSGGNAGFNGFFTDSNTNTTNQFATLGDTSGTIGSTPDSGISTLSQTFTLLGTISQGTVESYDLRIQFRTVFDGRDDGNSANGADTFLASLNAIALFSQSSTPLPNDAPNVISANNQLVNDPFNAVIFGLLPGVYTLTFSLNESASTGTSGGATNTAAGVDAVSVNATANLVPEPSTLALVGAALVGLALRRRNA
jgi:hypothetical protein